MCKDFAGKMYCRCCGERFYFDVEQHKADCPHEVKRKQNDLEKRVANAEAEIARLKSL